MILVTSISMPYENFEIGHTAKNFYKTLKSE